MPARRRSGSSPFRDSVAGRTAEVDPLLDWVEQQVGPITDNEILHEKGNAPMVNAAQSLKEVFRHFWALFNPLVAEDNTAKGKFANVPRHNGLKARRRRSEPINEDEALEQKDLSPLRTKAPETVHSADFQQVDTLRLELCTMAMNLKRATPSSRST